MARKYHSLLVLTGNTWTIQFGDYDLDCVKQEREDSYSGEVCKVITTGAKQKDIESRVQALNTARALDEAKRNLAASLLEPLRLPSIDELQS